MRTPPQGSPAHNSEQSRPRVTNAEDAAKLVDAALAALDALEPLVMEETRLFKAGKVREALGMAMTKNTAAQYYTRCLEVLKGNAIAIGRFQPERLDELKERHGGFSAAMALNLAVVSTARTVSEGLLRDLADAMGRNASPKTYSNGTITRKAGTMPLALSRMS